MLTVRFKSANYRCLCLSYRNLNLLWKSPTLFFPFILFRRTKVSKTGMKMRPNYRSELLGVYSEGDHGRELSLHATLCKNLCTTESIVWLLQTHNLTFRQKGVNFNDLPKMTDSGVAGTINKFHEFKLTGLCRGQCELEKSKLYFSCTI